jgi:hypothetical protein
MADTWFAGDHPRSGDWETLKGRTLEPHIAAPLVSTSINNQRGQTAKNWSGDWSGYLHSHDAPTRGGGTMAK